ncbi:unnamed protein product [Protopolystoma xenopodis]|uniref:Uncharacterized protein n=1 Tax=Protopolystoma xenopodis TaxID=117903 RepID=A0A448X3C7_9PLAT|nr:unnamed protein product [Protopolystoma xenopodis]
MQVLPTDASVKNELRSMQGWRSPNAPVAGLWLTTSSTSLLPSTVESVAKSLFALEKCPSLKYFLFSISQQMVHWERVRVWPGDTLSSTGFILSPVERWKRVFFCGAYTPKRSA